MTGKVRVKIFLPVGVCGCSQVYFMQRVYNVVKKYRDVIEYEEGSADSIEAKEWRVGYRGILIGLRVIRNNPTEAKIESVLLEELSKMHQD